MKKLLLLLSFLAVVVVITSTAFAVEPPSHEFHRELLNAVDGSSTGGESITWWIVDLLQKLLDKLASLGG